MNINIVFVLYLIDVLMKEPNNY